MLETLKFYVLNFYSFQHNSILAFHLLYCEILDCSFGCKYEIIFFIGIKRTRDYDDHLNDMMDNKFLAMCDALDQKFRNRDEGYRELTRTVVKLRERIDSESQKVSRLRRDVSRLKTENKLLKRTVRRHAHVMSKLLDEGMELLIEDDNSEREGQSDDSEHGELANVDQPLSF